MLRAVKSKKLDKPALVVNKKARLRVDLALQY